MGYRRRGTYGWHPPSLSVTVKRVVLSGTFQSSTEGTGGVSLHSLLIGTCTRRSNYRGKVSTPLTPDHSTSSLPVSRSYTVSALNLCPERPRSRSRDRQGRHTGLWTGDRARTGATKWNVLASYYYGLKNIKKKKETKNPNYVSLRSTRCVFFLCEWSPEETFV